jgi:hypothetical protein
MMEFERYAGTAAAFVRLAMIRLMLKRLTRPTNCSRIETLRMGSYKNGQNYILINAPIRGLPSPNFMTERRRLAPQTRSMIGCCGSSMPMKCSSRAF